MSFPFARIARCCVALDIAVYRQCLPSSSEGYESVSDFGVTVVLDTKLTEQLIEEGFVREVISKLQTMRKDAGFEVMDRINVTLKVCDKIRAYVEANMAQIKEETLSESVSFTEPKGYVKEWNINGEDSVFGVERI